jgi:hypothetical protein
MRLTEAHPLQRGAKVRSWGINVGVRRLWHPGGVRLWLLLAIIGGCGGQSLSVNGDSSDLGRGDLAGGRSCGRATPNPSPRDPLATARYGLVATWDGTATIPPGWVPPGPYSVEFVFAADGTYSARTVDNSGGNPLYYDKSAEKDRYELIDVHANGDVSGNIYLEWLTSPDDMKAIRFNAALSHLHFEYFHFGYGPVVYELDCAP